MADARHATRDDAAECASLRDLLELEVIEVDMYRSTVVFSEPHALYGGQVAAQALRAAALTVEGQRLPHSLHGYFLRAGDASKPTLFTVYRDRDGRSFSARRVVAVQDGAVIFNLSTSFQAPGDGSDDQDVEMPTVPAPSACAPYRIPRLFSYEGRSVEQPYGDDEWPTRFWARCTAELDDPVRNACALTYLSDMSSGLSRFRTAEHAPSSSLDHAVWFHRPARAAGWTLTDLVPRIVSAGRGWYTGSMFDESGRLLASFAQEALFRRHVRPTP